MYVILIELFYFIISLFLSLSKFVKHCSLETLL